MEKKTQVVHMKLDQNEYKKLLKLKAYFKLKSNNATGRKIINILSSLLELINYNDTITIVIDNKEKDILLRF